PPPRAKEEGLTRVAFLDSLPPAERRAALTGYERALSDEIRRLRSAPRPDGYRGEARRGAIERLEATRRWVRGLAAEGAPAQTVRETKRGVSGRA
ncbi:MAG: hypothetical protein ABR576_15135, partial [Thermoanaerobaculia bacterium]